MIINRSSLFYSTYYFLNFQGYSCLDLINAGMRHSGVYYLQIRGTTYWYLKVYCEQEIADGGWTVSISLLSTQRSVSLIPSMIYSFGKATWQKILGQKDITKCFRKNISQLLLSRFLQEAARKLR